jgi:surface protein
MDHKEESKDMARINYSDFYKNINFDVNSQLKETYIVKQNDTLSRGFYVKVIQNGRVVQPTAYDKMTLYVKKPDGKDIFEEGVIYHDRFKIGLPNQALTVPGKMRAEFTLRGSGGEVISSKDFTIIVNESFPMDPVESTDEFGALQSALAQIAGFAGELQDIQLFAESIKANLGELEDLDTDVKENVVAAINELNGKIDNVLDSEELETLLNAKVDKDTLGNPSELLTEEKEVIVNAINELFEDIEEIRNVSDIGDLLQLLNSKADKSTVGDIANLVDFEDEEVEINNLVEAVNYTYQLLVTSLEGLGEINLEDLALSEDLGNKEELTTDDKTNIVNAINEINAALKTVESVTDVEQLSILLSGKADKSSVGNLSELSTTQKNNLVAAINELKAIIDGLEDVDLTEIYNLLDDKVSQADFDSAINALQSNIDTIELTPGPPGEPGADGKSAYQIWLDEGNSGTEQDFLDSLKGPQGPPGEGGSGEIDQEFIDTVENNKKLVNSMFGRDTNWAYFFANQDLETIDFSNISANLPGSFYRDNRIQGISYNMYGMFSGATFPTPPPGDPFDWKWDPDIPDSNFWKWFMNFETWMEIEPSSLEYMFANAKGDVIMLPEFMIDEPISAKGMFSGAEVNKIDFRWGFGYGINNMSRMFYNLSNPDGGPTEVDLSRLETREVVDMSRMFAGSQATTLDLSSFDTSSVTDMSGMFADSQATTLDLRSFNTSSVTNMFQMFYNCQATKLDLSSFDTSNVTNMSYMFFYSQVTILDLSSFDTSNVKNMNGMFQNCEATIGYARTQADADRFNASLGKPSSLNFVVHPDLV